MVETGIGATSSVGSFAEGRSPYGVFDLLGNVWEWTNSLYKQYPYHIDDGREEIAVEGYRVVRGGAFPSNRINVRCAARGKSDPVVRDSHFGFRVVSPGF